MAFIPSWLYAATLFSSQSGASACGSKQLANYL
jgi:hypothetical protein